GLWPQGALDLDRPERATGQEKQEIDLRTGSGAIEMGGGAGRCRSQKVLDREAFPAGADHRMGQELVERPDAQQRMQDAAVAHIDLRRLDQALADIGMKG